MADNNIIIKLGVDVAALQKSLQRAQDQLKKTGKEFQRIGKDLSTYVTAPLIGFGAASLRTAGNFEAAMNRVQAITRATGTDFTALSGKARELGKNTIFSANEAANALEMLARNGLNTTQILGGAADAALNLAGATGADLSFSADIATDAMANFGIEANQMQDVVNKIVGATNASKFSIEDFGYAMGQAGGVAGKVGVEFSDFAKGIALTSSAFSSGSDAGTSFKTFLIGLNPKSKEAATEMERLGLNFFEANGQMKSLRDITGELANAFGGLTEKQRLQSSETIFGRDAMRTALSLADKGVTSFDALSQSVESVNAASIASAKLAGLNGQLKLLSSAFEELQIVIAETGLLKTVTGLVEKFTAFINRLSATNKEVIRSAVEFAALAAAAGPVLFIAGKLMTAIGSLSTVFAGSKLIGGIKATAMAFGTFNLALLPITVKVGLVVAALAGLVLIAKSINDTWSGVGKFFGKLWDAIYDTFSTAIGFISDMWTKFLNFIGIESISEITDAAASNFQAVFDAIGEAAEATGLDTFVDNVKKNFTDAVDFAKEAGEKIAGYLSLGEGGFSSNPVTGSTASGESEGGTGNQVITAPIVLPDMVLDEQVSQIDSLAKAYEDAQERMATASQAIATSVGQNLGELVTGGKSLQGALKGILQSVVQSLINAAVAAIAAGEAINKSWTGFGAIALAAGAAAAAGAFFNAMPTFANGGLVSGTTMGVMGEYLGAANNPEVIAPLSDLDSKIQASVMNAMGAGGGNKEPQQIRLITSDVVISKEDLRIALQQANEDFTQNFG